MKLAIEEMKEKTNLTREEIRVRRTARREAREVKLQRDIRERYVLKDAIKERDDKIVALEQELAYLRALHARVISEVASTPSNTVTTVSKDLIDRERVGVQKYGTTVDRTDLSHKQWLQHAYEELLDGALYLKRVIQGLPD